MRYNYIVVEGTIGSRKTELAEKLAFFLDAIFIRENINQNPFLTFFLQQPKNYALATQLQFLLDRNELMDQISKELQKNEITVISDCLIDKDAVFAPETLNQEELVLYWRLKQRLAQTFNIQPDLVILLQVSEQTIYTNLSSKENELKDAYSYQFIKKITTAYQRFFYTYPQIPFLIANGDELDLINNEDHFQLLIKSMHNLQGKINYLNLHE